ncbi:MAG: hypothetical protein ACLFUB_02630 [Cyclobacteriaceae bacterium]
MKKPGSRILGESMSSNGKNPHPLQFQSKKEKTERSLLFTLVGALVIVFFMLIYLINEWLEVRGASEEYLQTHFNFGAGKPFYRESADAYLRFTLRFMIIYFLITLFGIVSILLRKSWLYLLNILLAFIAILYFFLL